MIVQEIIYIVLPKPQASTMYKIFPEKKSLFVKHYIYFFRKRLNNHNTTNMPIEKMQPEYSLLRLGVGEFQLVCAF